MSPRWTSQPGRPGCRTSVRCGVCPEVAELMMVSTPSPRHYLVKRPPITKRWEVTESCSWKPAARLEHSPRGCHILNRLQANGSENASLLCGQPHNELLRSEHPYSDGPGQERTLPAAHPVPPAPTNHTHLPHLGGPTLLTFTVFSSSNLLT